MVGDDGNAPPPNGSELLALLLCESPIERAERFWSSNDQLDDLHWRFDAIEARRQIMKRTNHLPLWFKQEPICKPGTLHPVGVEPTCLVSLTRCSTIELQTFLGN